MIFYFPCTDSYDEASLRCNQLRSVAPAVYNANRIREKPIPKIPDDVTSSNGGSESEHEPEGVIHEEINDSNGAENSTTAQEIDDTNTTNSNGAESAHSLLPMELVFLPDVAIEEAQNDDIIKLERIYEMNGTDEMNLNDILEEGDDEQETESSTIEKSRNDSENAQPQNENENAQTQNKQSDNENENHSLQQQQNENNEEGAIGSDEDDSIIWLEDKSKTPLPSNATIDGLIKRENDVISGSLPYYMKVKILV